MLPSKKRLSRSDFNTFLQKEGIRVVFNNLGTLKYAASKQNQVSVVTSSKHEKRAVYRNKLRRRIYACFSLYFINNPKPMQYVLYCSKKASTLPFTEVKTLIHELLKKTTK